MSSLLVKNDRTLLERELGKLVTEFGVETVQEALKRVSRRPAGRPKIDDWSKLTQFLDDDASRLRGETDAKRRSNRSIAKELAATFDNHSYEATFARIMLKLGKHRDHYATVFAAFYAAAYDPWTEYLKFIDTLSEGKRSRTYWTDKKQRAQHVIERFTCRFGEPPIDRSFAEIEHSVDVLERQSGFGLRHFIQQAGVISNDHQRGVRK